MSVVYDPADDALDTILTGLLPALILGLFSGFKDKKKEKFSFINVFDDLVIFGSIVAYPLYTAIEWYQYNDRLNKMSFKISSIILTIVGTCAYIRFLYQNRHKIEENKN